MSTDTLASRGLEPVVAPVLIGTSAALILFGIISAASCTYLARYARSERKYTNIFVAVLFLLSTIRAGLDIANIYLLTMYTPLTDEDLAFGPITTRIKLGISILINALCQGWFVWRCAKAQGRKMRILTYLNLPSIAIAAGSGLAALIIAQVDHVGAAGDAVAHAGLVRILISSWLLSGAWLDLIISGTLTARLLAGKQDAFTKQTEAFTNHLLRMTLATCALTTIVAVADAVVFLTSASSTSAHLAFLSVLAPLYVCNVLYVLHSRERRRELIDTEASNSTAPVLKIASLSRVPSPNALLASKSTMATSKGSSATEKAAPAPKRAAITRKPVAAVEGAPAPPKKSVDIHIQQPSEVSQLSSSQATVLPPRISITRFSEDSYFDATKLGDYLEH